MPTATRDLLDCRTLYDKPADIPIIDLANLDGSTEERKQVLERIDWSFQNYGFMYLANHGIPQDVVDQAFVWSKRFFALSYDTKKTIAHAASGEMEDHRGFAEQGLGHVSQMVFDRDEVDELRVAAPERKETLEMGNPRDQETPNRWVDEGALPGFREFMEGWWDHCTALNKKLLVILCEILNAPDKQLLCKQQVRDVCHMSLAFYPSVPVKPIQNQEMRRLNAHTDFGQLTVLFQDMVGGLEVHDGSVFRPVVPKQGTAIINVGDLLERQSNGRWKSALHQVNAPHQMMAKKGSAEAAPDRYSIIWFGAPDPDVLVETLPGCEQRGKWVPNMVEEAGEQCTAGDWIQKRLAVEY